MKCPVCKSPLRECVAGEPDCWHCEACKWCGTPQEVNGYRPTRMENYQEIAEQYGEKTQPIEGHIDQTPREYTQGMPIHIKAQNEPVYEDKPGGHLRLPDLSLQSGMALGDAPHGDIIIEPGGKELFRMKPNGEVEIAEGVTMSDAARVFWEGIGMLRPSAELVRRLQEENEQLKKKLEEYERREA